MSKTKQVTLLKTGVIVTIKDSRAVIPRVEHHSISVINPYMTKYLLCMFSINYKPS